MFSFYFLGVLFANFMACRFQMPLIGTPIISIKAGNAERCKQSFEFQKDLIFMRSQNIGEYLSTLMVDRMPQPALIFFLTHEAPHFIQLRLLYLDDLYGHLLYRQDLQQCVIDRLKGGFFFFNSLITVVGLIFKTRAVSRMPLPLSAISMIFCLISGNRPL